MSLLSRGSGVNDQGIGLDISCNVSFICEYTSLGHDTKLLWLFHQYRLI